MRYDYSRYEKAILKAQYAEYESRILGEIRTETRNYKDFIQDPKTGRMMGRKSSKKPAKSLTKSKKRDKIKSGQFMTKAEKSALSSAILTDHPNLPHDGTVRYKNWRGCTYAFIVKGYGDYKFIGKTIIKGKKRS